MPGMPAAIMKDSNDKTPGPPTRETSARRRLYRRLLVAGLITGAVGGGGFLILLAGLSRDLPELRTLEDYRPPQSTVVYGMRGQVVARFARERRTVVPYTRIPRVMVNAVIASEDAAFFEHEGLDYLGIARCMVKNVLSGRTVCGGSTITQQTVKTFFLTPRRTYTRKLREVILARRLEQALSKDDILFLYLNQIYFGHGAYGVQEASRVYFAKDVSELDVAEAALLAGLPQSPSRLDPYRYPERALARRAYVLGQLRELGFIDEAAFTAAKARPLELTGETAESDLDSSNHYAAHVRKLLTEWYGEDRTTGGGLKVYTGLDPNAQRTAEAAVRSGLGALDKRQGWRGPILHLEPDVQATFLRALDTRRKTFALPEGDSGPRVFDLSRLEQLQGNLSVEAMLERVRMVPLVLERPIAGIVTAVDDPGREARVTLGGEVVVHLPLRTGLNWARPFDIHRMTPRPRTPSAVLKRGDVVWVRPTAPRPKAGSGHYLGVLEQTPRAQAALVAIDPHTREVRALVGGYGLGAGTFNRAVQARRQAGSTFKPFVYAAAFETKQFTPVSVCLDAPRVYRDPWTQRSWKPQNYGRAFHGEITLRTALTMSKNLCSVELIDKVGVEPVLRMAARAGVESPLPRNLTLALGSGDVTPLEMTNAFATLAAGGRSAPPTFITKAVDPEAGALRVPDRPAPQVAIPAEVAYQVTSLMQSVVEDGTARRVKVLKRPVAGKTGTTNEARNAWFIGFTPDLVAGVWVGFDNNDPLGPTETGGRAAIPIWLDFMKTVVKEQPVRDFVPPGAIVFAFVDPKTGKLAPPEFDGARNEPFIVGTEPTEFVDSVAPPDRLMWEDYE